jgi:cellobiose phosphorylase
MPYAAASYVSQSGDASVLDEPGYVPGVRENGGQYTRTPRAGR